MESGHYNSSHQTEEEDLEMCPPVSPISQSISSSIFSISIILVLELETLITETQTLELIGNVLLPLNTRFSSIIESDKKGVPRWKKVQVRIEDHFIITTTDLERKDYDEQLREYLSTISSEWFREEKPLWEVHLIKYDPKTVSNGGNTTAGGSSSSSTLIFKLNHALGDGYSFMSLILKAFKRADNPSLPFTFPHISFMRPQNDQVGIAKNLLGFFVKCKNTASDLTWNLLKSTVFEDRPSPIRSATMTNKMDSFRPFDIHSVTLSLERVKQVRTKLGMTVNDVLMGLITYMIHLYALRTGYIHHHHQASINGRRSSSSITIMVMINMRMLKGHKSIEEMIKAATWGNHSRFLQVTIPSFTDLENVNPLDFIAKAKETMNRKKDSMFVYLIDAVLNATWRIRGQKGLAKMFHSSFKNASTMITSVIGPKEQAAVVGHPITDIYFIVTGVPQSITFSSVTYMEQLKLVVTMEKGFINSQLFTSCMDDAFENIFQAAFGNYEANNKKSN